MFFLQDKGNLKKKWVLLDSQSTVYLFRNALLLTNIRTMTFHLDVFYNAGNTSTNVIGDLEGCGGVRFYPNSISIIISLHFVAEHLHVIYDSYVGNCFTVWTQNGRPRKFIPYPRGLYFCNLWNIHRTILITTDTGTSKFRSVSNKVTNKSINIALSTIDIVEDNKSLYTQ